MKTFSFIIYYVVTDDNFVGLTNLINVQSNSFEEALSQVKSTILELDNPDEGYEPSIWLVGDEENSDEEGWVITPLNNPMYPGHIIIQPVDYHS